MFLRTTRFQMGDKTTEYGSQWDVYRRPQNRRDKETDTVTPVLELFVTHPDLWSCTEMRLVSRAELTSGDVREILQSLIRALHSDCGNAFVRCPADEPESIRTALTEMGFVIDPKDGCSLLYESPLPHWMAIYMLLGLSIGSAVGSATSTGMPVGLCMGLAVGTSLGAALDQGARKKREDLKAARLAGTDPNPPSGRKGKKK